MAQVVEQAPSPEFKTLHHLLSNLHNVVLFLLFLKEAILQLYIVFGFILIFTIKYECFRGQSHL
jgi:hypothetical protein